MKGRPPDIATSISEDVIERCCFCGEKTSDRIYVREDPEVPVYHYNHAYLR